MSLTVKSNNSHSNKQKDIPEKGSHLARVVALVDLGHQPAWEYNGETIKDSNKITFTYELVASEMEDGRPHWVSEDLNVSDYESTEGGISSTMMKRVRSIDVDNITQDGVDLTKLINLPCLVTITYNKKGYPKVGNVTPVPAGMEVQELRNTPYVFNLDDPDMNIWDTFPQFVKDKIMRAINFPESSLETQLL